MSTFLNLTLSWLIFKIGSLRNRKIFKNRNSFIKKKIKTRCSIKCSNEQGPNITIEMSRSYLELPLCYFANFRIILSAGAKDLISSACL